MLSKETRKKLNLSNLLSRHLIRRAFALEEGEPTVQATATTEPTPVQPTATQGATPTANYEKLIEQAIKEERAKLYPEIERLKSELTAKQSSLNELAVSLNNKDGEIATLKKSLENAKAHEANSKELAKAQATIKELEDKLVTANSKINQVELDYYKKSKLRDFEGQIIPDLVYGTTKEEIDASIENSKKRYEEILASALKNNTPQPKTNVNQALFNGGVVNPSTTPFNRGGMSAQDISAINLRTPEGRRQFEELKKQMNMR